jgi:hypothetical protein
MNAGILFVCKCPFRQIVAHIFGQVVQVASKPFGDQGLESRKEVGTDAA